MTINNLAYELPGVDDLKVEPRKFNANSPKYKSKIGRQTKSKFHFSTLINASNVTFNQFLKMQMDALKK